MHYYKNSELVDMYGVSRRTVLNWIEQTQGGRIDLELQEDDGKFYVAKTPKNQVVMNGLVNARRKYLNKKSLKVVSPKPKFYELYNEVQILDIISNIDTYREIPLQYSYFDGGADYWDQHSRHLYEESAPNTLNSTVHLLNTNIGYIDAALKDYEHVNVVDVGVGNGLPVKGLLEHLIKVGKLKRYIGIDISASMLKIAEHNIKDWFGNKVAFEGYVRDASYERFVEVLAEPPRQHPKKVANLVLLFGSTLSNLREAQDGLKVIRKSMRRDDLFLYDQKLDSPTTREQFDYSINLGNNLPLPPECERMIELLGINEEYYDVEVGFDEKERARYARIRLKHALTINFRFSQGDWLVHLKKDERLLVWRARHNSAFDITNQLYANGFNPLLISKTLDHDYILVLSDLRKDGR